MENPIRENAVDEDLSEIMDIVDTIKSDPEERKRYMGNMGVIDYEKRGAYEKGEIQGVIQTCKSMNADKKEAKEKVMEQFLVDEDKAKEYIILYWDKPLDKPGNNE